MVCGTYGRSNTVKASEMIVATIEADAEVPVALALAAFVIVLAAATTTWVSDTRIVVGT